MRKQAVRYGKPCMTDLPQKEGKMIITEIINAKAPDKKKLEFEARKTEIKLVEHMKKYA